MQIVLGCGSGTLVNAGSGNAVGAVALPFFAIGSFAGAWHLDWWTGLGTAPVVAFGDAFGAYGGLALTLVLLAMVAIIALRGAKPEHRRIPRRLWLAAGFIALLAIANLVIAGQPWGVVYGLGLWAAKGAAALGADLSGSAFWSAPANMERVSQSLLTDVTSLTNIGIIAGAMLVASWRRGFDQPVARLPAMAWVAAIVAGLLLGYSSRLAFGCNVGAFFSGISTGSLHGWVLVRRRLRRFHPRCEAARAAGFRRRTEAGRPAMKIISSRRPVALAVGLFPVDRLRRRPGRQRPAQPLHGPVDPRPRFRRNRRRSPLRRAGGAVRVSRSDRGAGGLRSCSRPGSWTKKNLAMRAPSRWNSLTGLGLRPSLSKRACSASRSSTA